MDEIRIILLGKTGSGKSKTGNTIIGENFFHFGSNPTSVTEECLLKSSVRFGHRVEVIDTPGMFDTTRNSVDIHKEVKRSMVLSTPGPHAILLCVPMTTMSTDDIKVLEHYLEFFGEEMLKYTIVAFTMLDLWEDDLRFKKLPIDRKRFITKELKPEMRRFLSDCGERHLFINNNKENIDESVMQLFSIIEKMQERLTVDAFYTNESFDRLQKALEEEMKATAESDKIKTKKDPKFFAKVFTTIISFGRKVAEAIISKYIGIPL